MRASCSALVTENSNLEEKVKIKEQKIENLLEDKQDLKEMNEDKTERLIKLHDKLKKVEDELEKLKRQNDLKTRIEQENDQKNLEEKKLTKKIEELEQQLQPDPETPTNINQIDPNVLLQIIGVRRILVRGGGKAQRKCPGK